MGRGKKGKPADSSAEEPDNPPPVAPRPGANDSAFEQEKSSKKVDKSIKKDGEDPLPLLLRLHAVETAPNPPPLAAR